MSIASKPISIPRSTNSRSKGLQAVRRVRSRTNLSSSGCTADSTAGGGVPYLNLDIQRLILDKAWESRGKLDPSKEVQVWTNLALVNPEWLENLSKKPVSLHFKGTPSLAAKTWLSERSHVRISALSFFPDEEEFQVFYIPCKEEGGAGLSV